MGYERVYTITDWYDGARGGIANLNGEPHYYENSWNEEYNNWNKYYVLLPIDVETFNFAIEDWNIWLRWENAFKNGETPHKTHPALPKDKKRHNELEKILRERLKISSEKIIQAEAEFKYGDSPLVRWTVIQSVKK
jgi:hypothetical protein